MNQLFEIPEENIENKKTCKDIACTLFKESKS